MKKTIKRELKELLSNSDIESIHGKFYMRFELGGEGNKDYEKRINQATERGTEIYKQLIGEDEIIIVIQEWEEEFFDRYKKNMNYIYNLLGNPELKKIEGPFEQVYYEKNIKGTKVERVSNEPLECDLILGKVNISIEKAKLIIKGIASLEMGGDPCIPQDIYFYSFRKQVGFRIYDDRGCDIWSNSLEELRQIYNNLNSWILEYNRKEIDAMFKK